MDAATVQRVLVENTHAREALGLMEALERDSLALLRGPQEALSASEREELVRREQFQLGRIEGLVQAQLALDALREDFSRRHRPSAAAWRRSPRESGSAG